MGSVCIVPIVPKVEAGEWLVVPKVEYRVIYQNSVYVLLLLRPIVLFFSFIYSRPIFNWAHWCVGISGLILAGKFKFRGGGGQS